jgi:hypothetical protein
MFVGYQSTAGKRIMLRSKMLADGTVRAEMAHLNPTTRKVETLLRRVKRTDAVTGRIHYPLEVAGVDVGTYFATEVVARKAPAGNLDALARFMASDVGQAYAEAVPAIYAAVEPMEVNAKDSLLQSPFGLVLTVLQLSTAQYGGFEHAERTVGRERANLLRLSCGDSGCKYRGKHFTVHSSGLFDVVSKSKLSAFGKKACADSSQLPSALSVVMNTQKNGNGICDDPGGCFGACGPLCWNPGNIWTIECFGHDLCACRWGHMACIFSIPEDGEYCATFGEAAASFFEAFFAMFGSTPPEFPDEEEDPFERTWN